MKTILLVDDESALVETLTELLEGEGYRVVSAANGNDGLALLQEARPDLVLVDLWMPIANGQELVRRMRALADFQFTPVVIMSAKTNASGRSDAPGTVEAQAFVAKPFRWDKLLQAIVRLIGK